MAPGNVLDPHAVLSAFHASRPVAPQLTNTGGTAIATVVASPRGIVFGAVLARKGACGAAQTEPPSRRAKSSLCLIQNTIWLHRRPRPKVKITNAPEKGSSILSRSDRLVKGATFFRVDGSGIAGRTYRLQFSDGSSPFAWQDLSGGSVIADSEGVFTFLDTSGTTSRFYRSVFP